jgi:hypothetical protein
MTQGSSTLLTQILRSRIQIRMLDYQIELEREGRRVLRADLAPGTWVTSLTSVCLD